MKKQIQYQPWEAVYFPNPIPLTSQTLITLALLFDKVHFPGLTLPLHKPQSELEEKWLNPLNYQIPSRNRDALLRWSLEFHRFADWCVVPEYFNPDRHSLAISLLSNSFTKPLSKETALICCEMVTTPETFDSILALTGPAYRANALLYCKEHDLPLVSDDLGAPVPLMAPSDGEMSERTLAMAIALEAVQMSLPPVRSSSPALIQEFREAISPLAAPFRAAMSELTAKLQIAVAGDVCEADLKQLASHLVEASVAPMLSELQEDIRCSGPIANRIFHHTDGFGFHAAGKKANLFSIATTLFESARIKRDLCDISRVQNNRSSDLYYLLKVDSQLTDKAEDIGKDWHSRNWMLDFELKMRRRKRKMGAVRRGNSVRNVVFNDSNEFSEDEISAYAVCDPFHRPVNMHVPIR